MFGLSVPLLCFILFSFHVLKPIVLEGGEIWRAYILVICLLLRDDLSPQVPRVLARVTVSPRFDTYGSIYVYFVD